MEEAIKRQETSSPKTPWSLDSEENIPPLESITPPSLRNLSLEEEINGNNEHEAPLWEASVARNLDLLSRSSLPYPKKDPYSRRSRDQY